MTDLKTQLEKAFRRVDIPPANIEKFIAYIEILKEWNRKVALISKREENIVSQLVAPSLLFFKFFKGQKQSVVDIGTGAGFPAIVLKIYNPSLNITMIESNYKKCGFLRYVCAKLDLECTILNSRVEDLEKEINCDVITTRALKLEPLLPEIKRKVKGGYLFFITSKDNHLTYLSLEKEIIFKKWSAQLYRL